MTNISNILIEKLRDATKVAVLTGAGISAESGVPTFRGKDGWWKKHRPEELATHEAFSRDPELVWEWYQYRRDLVLKIEPNPGHYALVEMEKHISEFTMITQNVDGLHRRAGSSAPIELHGNIMLTKCVSCSKDYSNKNHSKENYPDLIKIDPSNIPKCTCGGLLRPGVVWFGEMLPEKAMEDAQRASAQSEVFFSIGTSAIVYPAAYYPLSAKNNGAYLVEINIDSTPLTPDCDLFLQGKSGDIIPEIVNEVWD